MLKILTLAALLVATASGTPFIRHKWQINANKLFPDALRGNERIIGGEVTHIGIIPHQVGVFHDGSHICGGSILNENTILSAAHCTQGKDHSKFSILAGHTVLDPKSASVIKVTDVREHEQYVNTAGGYDLVIFKLEKNLVYSQYIRPVNLPQAGHDVPSGRYLTVSGWGTIEHGTNKSPTYLLSTPVPALSNGECQALYTAETIFEHQVCAGKYGHDACQGDSGGPLTEYVGESRAMIIGVVSYGYGCGQDFPTVYARVSSFLDWIKNHMNR